MNAGYILILATLASLCIGNSANATEQTGLEALNHDLSLHGFGTLGVARSTDDEVQLVRDLSQPAGLTTHWSAKIDSVLGVQADYRFNDEFEGILQAISRYRYDGSYKPEISWAFLRYDPRPDVTLRAGRLGTEFFMTADSRLVGYANLTVRPSPDYFGPLIFSYFDGADVSVARPFGDGLLRGKMFAGWSPEKTLLADDIPWDLTGSLLAGGHLEYVSGPWQIRLSHTQVRFDKEIPINQLVHFDITAAVPEVSIAGKWTRYDALGVVYDRGPFQAQVMLNQIDQGNSLFEDSRAGYTILSYRVGNVTPFLGYSRVESRPVQFPSTAGPYAVAADLAAASHSDQHTWTLGARWDVRPNMDLKAQADWIRGSSSSVLPFRGSTPWNGHMTVYSLALDFVF
jgi:hypothetical protein